MSHDDEETVAEAIAEAVGSRVFKPALHDTTEDQRVRNEFRRLAAEAISIARTAAGRLTR